MISHQKEAEVRGATWWNFFLHFAKNNPLAGYDLFYLSVHLSKEHAALKSTHISFTFISVLQGKRVFCVIAVAKSNIV